MKQQLSVLVIDDCPFVQKSMYAWLEDDDFRVFTSENASDAFSILTNIQIDVCIVDLTLPDKPGDCFLTEAIPVFPGTAFLLHTGDHNYIPSCELESLGVKYEDILFKPVRSLPHLSDLIRRKACGG